jgi:hypothetical protein
MHSHQPCNRHHQIELADNGFQDGKRFGHLGDRRNITLTQRGNRYKTVILKYQ